MAILASSRVNGIRFARETARQHPSILRDASGQASTLRDGPPGLLRVNGIWRCGPPEGKWDLALRASRQGKWKCRRDLFPQGERPTTLAEHPEEARCVRAVSKPVLSPVEADLS